MTSFSRRDALIHLGLGTAGLLARPRNLDAALGAPGLGELAEIFRRTPRGQVFDRAADAIRAGADFRALLGAAFVAGVQDIRPRSVGGKLHAVMMVESAFLLTERASDREAWLAALWSLDDFKSSQARDLGEGDWVLPPRPEARFADESAARRELVAAMESWDAERADRAIVGLLPFHDRASLFEILWPYGARCYVDIGHKVIFCTQVERVLGRLGWSFAEPAVRSLVNGLLYQDEGISPSELGVYARSRELVREIPVGWMSGREDPEESAVLLRGLRSCDPGQAQRWVVEAFRSGLGPATVWDGLRLYAAEVFHRRPPAAARRHGPVHPVTEVNAFAYAARRTANDATRRLLILQAAGWLPLLRRDLSRFFGAPEGEHLDTLGQSAEGTPPGLTEIFEERSTGAARVRLDARPAGAADFLGRLRSDLVRKAFQSHQYKYAAAVQEEAALVHPRWASRLLAPSITYLPGAGDPDSEVYERSLRALERAGVA